MTVVPALGACRDLYICNGSDWLRVAAALVPHGDQCHCRHLPCCLSPIVGFSKQGRNSQKQH